MSRTVLGAALLGAAGISVIALNDAATYALTGRYSAVSDEFGVSPLFVISGVVHAVAYLGFAGVLWQQRARVDGGSRVRRIVRRVLIGTLLVLAVGMAHHTGVSVASGTVANNGVSVAVAGTALLLMTVGSIVLGLSLLPSPGMRLPAWTLTGVLGAVAITVLLGVIGSPWAHPAYAETMVSFGLAFVGIAPGRDRTPKSMGDRHERHPAGASLVHGTPAG